MKNSTFLIVLAFVIQSSVVFGFQDTDRMIEVCDSVIDAINAKDAKQLVLLFSSELKREKGEKIASEEIDMMIKLHGKITTLESVRVIGNGARFKLVCERGRWVMELVFAPNGLITGIKIWEPTALPPVQNRNPTTLSLPFHGEWFVLAGGTTKEENYHRRDDNTSDSSYAVDFVIRDSNNKDFKNAGVTNNDYYAFGQEILAAAAGEVAIVLDGLPDNKPGTTNSWADAGNTVIINHGVNEYSAYFHLKLSSTTVHTGQRVMAGQVIGACGNSGYSSAPHLHFQMMNSLIQEEAIGFLPYFQNILVSRDKLVETRKIHTPVMLDFVKNKELK